MKKVILICSVIMIFACLSHANDTYPVTESDKDFFSLIQKALLRGDTEWLSQALSSYPFTVNMGNEHIELKSEKDLKKYAKKIFNSELKDDVRKQSSESLFKNWQGVMIGNGDIWFSEMGEKHGTNIVWRYQIIAINVPHDQSK